MDLTPALEAPLTGERPRADRATGRLSGSRCTGCAAPSWPARAVCHRCGSAALRPEQFGPAGTLLTYTVVHVPLRDLEAPYTLGQVRLDPDGPVVFGHVRGLPDGVTVPYPVRLVLSGDPAETPWYWFRPNGGATGSASEKGPHAADKR